MKHFIGCRYPMGAKILALGFLLLASVTPYAADPEKCTAPPLTEDDAMRHMLTPLDKLSEQGRRYAMIGAQVRRTLAEQQRLARVYEIDGLTGRTALQTLAGSGFECQFEVLQGLGSDATALTLRSADLPTYRCSMVDPSRCDCYRLQITWSLGSQAVRGPDERYKSELNAIVLDRSRVRHSCHDA